MRKLIYLVLLVVLVATGCATVREPVSPVTGKTIKVTERPPRVRDVWHAKRCAKIETFKATESRYKAEAKFWDNYDPKNATTATPPTQKGCLVNDRRRPVVFFFRGSTRTYSFTVSPVSSEGKNQRWVEVEMVPGRYYLIVREQGANRAFFSDWVEIDALPKNAYIEDNENPKDFVFRAW